MSIPVAMIRITKRLTEMFSGKIDLSDLKKPDESNFKTRTLAALALMMKCGINEESSCAHITDGYHDMGIDAIILDEQQKQLFLVQSKWRESGQGTISQEEMQSFLEGVRRIINLDYDGANSRIKAMKPDIDRALYGFDYQIHPVFIHTGNATTDDYALRPIRDLISAVNDENSTLVVYDEISCSDIYTFLAQGQESEEINLDDVILNNWGKTDEPFVSYYGTISASTIGKWYCEHGNRLFAKNIRYYKGKTDVNDGIKRVLLQEPEHFFYYNNGIKLLCKKIHRKAIEATKTVTGLFRLDGVSLVNGAQTAGSIGNVFREDPDAVSKAIVMIQIIDLSSASPEMATQITKLSNTQNRIENRDFAALDPVQDKIRQELSFSHFVYLYKDGDVVSNPENELSIDEATVALACLHPDITLATLAKRNVGALTEDITKPPYKILFNSGTNSFELLNSVLAVRIVESELNKLRASLLGRDKLVSVHGNRFIAYCVLQQVKNHKDFSTGVIPAEDLMREVSSLVTDLVSRIAAEINTKFPDAYPASIFKNSAKCGDIYKGINMLTRCEV